MSRFDKVIGYATIKEQMNMALDVMIEPEKYKKLGITP